MDDGSNVLHSQGTTTSSPRGPQSLRSGIIFGIVSLLVFVKPARRFVDARLPPDRLPGIRNALAETRLLIRQLDCGGCFRGAADAAGVYMNRVDELNNQANALWDDVERWRRSGLVRFLPSKRAWLLRRCLHLRREIDTLHASLSRLPHHDACATPTAALPLALSTPYPLPSITPATSQAAQDVPTTEEAQRSTTALRRTVTPDPVQDTANSEDAPHGGSQLIPGGSQVISGGLHSALKRRIKVYQCTVCSQTTLRFSAHMAHMKSFHPDAKLFKCPMPTCTRSFWRPDAAKRHLVIKHPGVLSAAMESSLFTPRVEFSTPHVLEVFKATSPSVMLSLCERSDTDSD